MNGITIALLIITGLILLFIAYKVFKPYVIKHDTTILFTGGLGSGKTLESVKKAIVLIRKNIFFKYTLPKFWRTKILNPIRKLKNKKRAKKGKIVKPLKPIPELPKLYSNIPIMYKKHILGRKKVWAKKLTVEHITCLKKINEYSVVLIDEFPQFISQFEWNEELVQTNVNEFITFFRHYIGGYLIINAQSEDEIECHVRRKLNIAIHCFDFKKHLCGLFYTNRMCDFMMSDNVQNVSTTYIEENTKLHFGLFPRKAYDTRCYSVRYKNIYITPLKEDKWKKLKTNEVLRLKAYKSPLDTITKEAEKERQLQRVKNLERNQD